MKEIWKDIEGCPNYQISNMGRVKSLERNVVRCRGGLYKIEEKILKGIKNNSGYFNVSLSKDNKPKYFSVHRLVAQAFIPNPNNYPVVNHKDEDKTNNTIWVNEDGSIDYNKSNLEWCSVEHNMNYGTRTKRAAKSKSIPILQFSKTDEFIKKWDSATEVQKELSFDKGDIGKCCRGKKKTCGGYKWGYADDYERIPFNIFDIELYRKKVA